MVEIRNNSITEAANVTPPGPAHWYRERALVAIVVVQAIWFWWAFSRGWFLQADLSNLADGAGRTLNWDYLSEPLGGHFGPVGRLLFWLVDEIGTLNYTSTVFFRVVCQAVSTVLLFRVLTLLIGRRPLVPALVAVYSVNPLLLAGGAWFTSGMGLVPGQVLALATLLFYVRFELTRRLKYAAIAGLLLGVTVLSADQWVVVALVPPLLSIIHFYRGGPVARLRETVQQYRAWLLLYVPLVLALAAVVGFGNASGSSSLSYAHGYHLLRESWLKTIGTSWVGGPGRWINGPGIYVSFTGPPDWMVLLGQVGVFVTVAVGVQRIGWRSLAAWIMPVITTVVGILIVGIGRYATYGGAIAITPRYFFQGAALFTVGAALALAPLADRAGEPGHVTDPSPPIARGLVFDRTQRWIAGAALCALLVMCLISGARFAVPLGNSPVRDYVANLETSARTYGSNVNIWDTPVPTAVISSYERSHRVSDILRLTGVPAKFDDPSSAPLIVTGDGHLTRAVFVAAASSAEPAGACGTFVHGRATVDIPLSHTVHSAEWFLHLDLYQAKPSDVTIEAVDGDGHIISPLRGARRQLGTLQSLNLALPLSAPAAIRVHSDSTSTNLCLAHVQVGGPFAVGG